MNVIVPIKQVPESSNVKMDPETGTVIRAGVETVVNPLDLYALEASLRLREKYDGKVTAISMGPPQATRALKEAVAMGCDGAVLLSDRKVSGSDTCATSYALAQMIRAIGEYDVIISGERATDGDTAQVGPGIASWLGIPVVTYVSKIEEIQNGRILLERLVEEGYQQLSTALPCLLTVVKEVATPRLPTLKGKIRSMELNIPIYTAQDVELNPDYVGLKGSPTKVVKIDTPKVTRNSKVMTAQDDISIKVAVDEFLDLIEKKGLLP
ncbi:MAG: electron transfer flavoprotein subunit beta/FixA family protein [Synergistaceae bacterium]|nr:electron transfer flavoprotein subunit beta/FixA family protein [Synergistaceae bacterium]